MRIFGFEILRTVRVDEMHKRRRELQSQLNEAQDDLVSERQITINQQNRIAALEKKCDIVGVSAMSNKLAAIKVAAHDTNGLFKVLELLGEKSDEQEMRDTELRETHRGQDGVLQQPLASGAVGTAPDDPSHGGLAGEDGSALVGDTISKR